MRPRPRRGVGHRVRIRARSRSPYVDMLHDLGFNRFSLAGGRTSIPEVMAAVNPGPELLVATVEQVVGYLRSRGLPSRSTSTSSTACRGRPEESGAHDRLHPRAAPLAPGGLRLRARALAQDSTRPRSSSSACRTPRSAPRSRRRPARRFLGAGYVEVGMDHSTPCRGRARARPPRRHAAPQLHGLHDEAPLHQMAVG